MIVDSDASQSTSPTEMKLAALNVPFPA